MQKKKALIPEPVQEPAQAPVEKPKVEEPPKPIEPYIDPMKVTFTIANKG